MDIILCFLSRILLGISIRARTRSFCSHIQFQRSPLRFLMPKAQKILILQSGDPRGKFRIMFTIAFIARRADSAASADEKAMKLKSRDQ